MMDKDDYSGDVELTTRGPSAEFFEDEEPSGALSNSPSTTTTTTPSNSRVQSFCQKTLLVSTIGLTIYYFTVVFVCSAQYFWREEGSWIVALCHPLAWSSWLLQPDHAGFPMWPPAIPLTALLCVIPTLWWLFPSFFHTKEPLLRRRGDPSIRLWAIFLLLLPTLVTLALMSGRSVPEKEQGKLDKTGYGDQRWALWFTALTVKYANATGYCAAVCLSFFMVPVSRQSPLLQALGLSPALAVGFHIWAGRLAWILVSIHGLLYAMEKPLFSKSSGTLLQKAIYELLPSQSRCWRLEPPWQFLKPDDDEGDDHCYHQWRNFTGILSGVFLVLLGLTSGNWIRRRHYGVFYYCHLVFGPLMLLFAVCHFYWIGLYLLPGILYYLVCSLPIFLASQQHPVAITQATLIPNSNGCFELQLAAPFLDDSPLTFPSYVRICVPEIARFTWHPFTLVSATNNDWTLLIRRTGPFTTALHQRILDMMTDDQPLTCLVDTCHSGPDWSHEIQQHETSLLVAGGIGITPILSVVLKLLSSLSNANRSMVHVHWYCREESLAQHVVEHFLQPVLAGKELEGEQGNQASGHEQEFTTRIRFTIHLTATTGIHPEKNNGEPTTAGLTITDTTSNPSPVRSTRNRRWGAAALLVGTTTLHLVWYNLATWNVRDRIFFRADILVAAIWIIIAGTVLLELVERNQWCGLQEHPRHQLVPTQDEDEEEQQSPQKDHGLTPLPSSWREPKSYKCSNDLLVSLEVSNGRPILHDVIDPVVESSAPPAVFFCGPDSLWNDVAQTIQRERRARHGSFAHCAFFKEHFEL